MDGEGRLRLLDVNPHLVCYLCGGYYVEATTIVECLHSFCKSCIIRYLENNSFCPICDVQIHKAKPYRNLRPDKALQNIVYKLVPDLYRKEMQRRRDFYAKHPEYALYAKPEDKGIELERMIFSPNENISLSLQYLEPQRSYEEWENISVSSHGSGPGSPPGLAVPASATAGPPPSASPPPPPARSRYLLCPAQVTVAVLKKFLRLKFELTPSHEVEMMHKREVLTDDLTLMDIAYIYTWKRNSPMELQYRFLEAGRPPPPVPPPSLPPAPWVHPCLRARPPPPAPVPRSIPSVPAAPFAPSTSSTSSVPATPAALVAAAAPTAHAIAELRAASAGPATFATPASSAAPTPASTPPAASAFTSLPAPVTAPVFTTSSLTATPSLPATPSFPDPPSPAVPPSSPTTSTHPGTCPLLASPKGHDTAASMSFPVRHPVKDMKASSSPAARSLGPGCAAATHKTPSSCKKNADARISASRERSKERAAAQGAAAQEAAAQGAAVQGAAANTGRGDESFHKAPHKEPRREGNPQEGVAPQDIAGGVAKRRPAPSPPRTRPRSPTPQRSPPPPRSPPPTRHKEAEKVVAAADTTGSPSASSAGSPSEAAALDAGKGSPPPPPLTLPSPAATSPPHLLPLSLAPPAATPPAPPRQRPPTPLPPSSPASRISIGLLASLALERKRPAPTAPTASITPAAAAPAGAGSVAKRPRAAPPALVTLKRPPTPVPPRIHPGPAPPDGHGKLSAIPRLIQIAPQPAPGKRRARPRSPPRAPHDGFGALDLSRARGQPGIATIAQNLARRQMMQQQLQLLHAAASPGASPPPSPLSPLATPRPSPHARPPPHAARPSSLSSSSPSPPADPPRARFGLPPPPPPPPPASAAAAAAAAAAFGDWYNEHLLRYLDNLRRAEMPLPPPTTHPHVPPPHARTPPHSHAAFYQYAAAAAAQAHAGRK